MALYSSYLKGIIGLKQLRDSNKINAVRPLRTIPSALKRLVDMTRFESSISGLPGQARMENKIAESGANTMNAISRTQQSPAAILAGLTAVNSNQQDAYADLGMQAAQYRDQKQGDYYNALNALSAEQVEQWKYNVADPYMEKMAAKSALKNAGLGNIMAGVEGYEQAGADAAGMLLGIPPTGGRQGGGQPINAGTPQQPVGAYGGYNPNAGGYGGLQPMQQGWGGNGGRVGGGMYGSNDDDWLMYSDQMRRTYPGVSDETLQTMLPSFKQNFNKAYYGY